MFPLHVGDNNINKYYLKEKKHVLQVCLKMLCWFLRWLLSTTSRFSKESSKVKPQILTCWVLLLKSLPTVNTNITGVNTLHFKHLVHEGTKCKKGTKPSPWQDFVLVSEWSLSSSNLPALTEQGRTCIVITPNVYRYNSQVTSSVDNPTVNNYGLSTTLICSRSEVGVLCTFWEPEHNKSAKRGAERRWLLEGQRSLAGKRTG